MKDDIQRCTKCTLPITWETIFFDNEGVCNICRNWEIKDNEIDWEEREKVLIQTLEEEKRKQKEKGNPYDCIVGFSGGKDSTYTLYMLVRKYKMRPLVVSFDHGFYRPRTLQNRTRTFRRLGVDVFTFTPNWRVLRKLMLEALIRRGDFCWHCHLGVWCVPFRMAINYNIPLIIWGEGGGEYEGYFKFQDLEENDEWKFNRRCCLGIRAEDMAGFIGEDLRDLYPYTFPTQEEMEKIGGIKSIPLGKYIPWNQEENAKLIHKELGWQYDYVESMYPGELTFEKVECMFTGIRDYIKYLKRNFSRITHRTTIDIKQGRITREEGMNLIKKYEKRKPHTLYRFLEILGLSEKEFNEICLMHLIKPAKPLDPNTIPIGKKLWDEDLWFKDNESEGRLGEHWYSK
ncbi:MAG: N-acetyl sugar amidotransferase [Candidatus Odinarchaeota archaeon]